MTDEPVEAAASDATVTMPPAPRAGRNRAAAPEAPLKAETRDFAARVTVVTGAGVFAPGDLVPLTRAEWEDMFAAGVIAGAWPETQA